MHGSAVVGGFIKESRVINDAFNCRFINLSTSASVEEIGRNSLNKLFRYLSLIWRVKKNLLFSRPQLCYFTPTAQGPGFYKDALVIALVKLFGVKTIYHYHNKGVSTRQDRFFDNLLYRFVFRNSYVILLSKHLYPDIQKYVPENRVFYCANGIPDGTGPSFAKATEGKAWGMEHRAWGAELSAQRSEQETPESLNLEPGTSNLEPRTSNLEPRTSNLEPGTSNLEPGTSNLEPGTSNLEPGTSNLEPGTSNLEPRTSNLEPGTSNLEPRTSNLEPGTSNLEPLTSNNKPAGLLFLSHLIISKGVLVLIDACELLKDMGVDFHCTIAGGDKELTRKEVEDIIKEKDLSGYISVVGPKHGEDKVMLMESADVMVHPSYEDCLPLVLLEAMQFSLPVVSTFEGAIPDVVDDGITGFLVPQKDPGALADKLEILVKDTGLRQKMGTAGRSRYEQQFTLERFEGRMVEILKEVWSELK